MRAGAVDHALPEVGEGLVGVVQPVPLGVHRDEGVLHDLLGGPDVVDQEDGEAHQLAPVRGVQQLERLVGAPAGRLAPGRSHQPDLRMSDHGSGTRRRYARGLRAWLPRRSRDTMARRGGRLPVLPDRAGRDPRRRRRRDRDAVAFRDVNPQAPLHVLVVPRAHVANAAELADTRPGDRGRAGAAWPARSPPTPGTRATGWSSTPATEAGQTVFHAHLHVLAGRSAGVASRLSRGARAPSAPLRPWPRSRWRWRSSLPPATARRRPPDRRHRRRATTSRRSSCSRIPSRR